MKSLNVTDEELYQRLLERAHQSWETTAAAISEIKERRLYLNHYVSFEAFIRAEFGRTKQWGYQLLATQRGLKCLPEGAIKPKTARAARQLGRDKNGEKVSHTIQVDPVVTRIESAPSYWQSIQMLINEINIAAHEQSMVRLKMAVAQLVGVLRS